MYDHILNSLCIKYLSTGDWAFLHSTNGTDDMLLLSIQLVVEPQNPW